MHHVALLNSVSISFSARLFTTYSPIYHSQLIWKSSTRRRQDGGGIGQTLASSKSLSKARTHKKCKIDYIEKKESTTLVHETVAHVTHSVETRAWLHCTVPCLILSLFSKPCPPSTSNRRLKLDALDAHPVTLSYVQFRWRIAYTSQKKTKNLFFCSTAKAAGTEIHLCWWRIWIPLPCGCQDPDNVATVQENDVPWHG